jgi:signal transduction histidine kinase
MRRNKGRVTSDVGNGIGLGLVMEIILLFQGAAIWYEGLFILPREKQK